MGGEAGNIKVTTAAKGLSFTAVVVRVGRLELPTSSSQRGSNLVLHVHENHLTLSAPENLLSGALFSAVSTSSKGGCGQTCGRIETLPWNAADLPSPRERLDCSLECKISQVIICKYPTREIRKATPSTTI